MANTSSVGRIVVVGGGIGGLTAGYRLKKAGFDVLLLEAEPSVGGRMSTIEKNGYRIDVGAAILVSSYKAMAKLLDDTGLRSLTAPTDDTLGFKYGGRVHHVRSHSAVDTAKTRLVSMRTKMKAAPVVLDVLRHGSKLSWEDPGRAVNLDRESAREYLDRRVGAEELVDKMISPICAGMALVGPEDLSAVDLLALFRNVFLSKFFNSATGVQFLPDGLARHLTVETNARVTGVEERRGEVSVTWSRAGNRIEQKRRPDA